MKAETETDAKPERNWRLRQSFRDAADRKNPHPGVKTLDSRGRPRERKTSHHSWIGKCRP